MNNFIPCWSLIPALIDILQPIKTTLGPQGNTNFIQGFSTILTKDGANILKHIHSDDTYLMALLNFIKDNINIVAQNTGDGTTTTIIFIIELLKIIDPLLLHYSGQEISGALQELLLYSKNFVEKITKSLSIKDENSLMNLAMIATNGHQEISQVLVEAIMKVGPDAIINVEKIHTHAMAIGLEYQRGFALDMGFSNKYFLLKNNAIAYEKKYTNGYILIANQRLAILTEQLQWVLNEAISQQKPLVIIAKEVEGDFLNHLIAAYNRNILDVITVKATYNSDDFLQDLCALTTCQMWDNKFVYPLEQYLGQFNSCEITQEKTIIFKEKNMDNYIDHLQKKMEILNKHNNHYTYEKSLLNQRITKLTGAVAKIQIGGSNEAEKEEIKDRVIDGIHCLKNAIRKGIVPGGGILFFLIHKFFQEKISKDGLSPRSNPLSPLISKSLLAILATIVNNGIDRDGPVIINKIYEFYQGKTLEEVVDMFHNKSSMMMGFNGYNNQLVDIMEDGIINAALTEMTSWETAISMVSHIIKSKYIINTN
jgi:chaperonin GroEL